MAAPPARTEISDTYPNPSNATARTGFGKLWDYATGLLGATGDQAEARAALGIGGVGQCRLTKSGSNLLLSRCNGIFLTVNNVNCTIPSGGVTLAPTSLSVGTTYYIYATASAGAINALEASTTGYAVNTTSGMMTKSGDATRTLVGMARIITGPAWVDTAAQRFVVSFFNRRPIQTASSFSTGRSTTSGSFVELNSEIRNEFLAWADNSIAFWASGSVSNGTAATTNTTALGLDGTSALEGINGAAMPTGINNQLLPIGLTTVLSAPADGYHYVTLLGTVSGGTGTWAGGTVGARCSVQGLING